MGMKIPVTPKTVGRDALLKYIRRKEIVELLLKLGLVGGGAATLAADPYWRKQK